MTPSPVAIPLKRPSAHASVSDWTTEALTRGLAEGDEQAYREFHRIYFDRLYRLLLGICRGEETQAQDALQETFCRVARYARRFTEEEIFWCWLIALARSAVRDAGRKHRRYWTLLENYALRWLPVQREPDPGEDSTLDRCLETCLAELEPEDRALVEEKYLNRLSTRDLAQNSGLSERAVESKLLRLRRHLRESLLERMKHDLL